MKISSPFLLSLHPFSQYLISSLQLLASPLIIPPTLEHVLQQGTIPTTLQPTTTSTNKQENLLQGA